MPLLTGSLVLPRHEKQGLTVVVLDEDVAQVFTTPEAVNKALRALIEAMPQVADE